MQKTTNKDGKTRWRHQYTDVDGKRRYLTAGSKEELQIKVREKKLATKLLGQDVESKEDRNRIKHLLGLDQKAKEHNLDLDSVLNAQIKLLQKTTTVVTVRKAIATYLKEKKVGSLHAKVWQPATLSRARGRLKDYLEWLDGEGYKDTPLHELQELPAVYLEHLQDKTSQDASDKMLRLFWGFYKWSVTKGYAPYSPVHSLKLLATEKDKGEADSLTIAEMKAVLRACISDYDHTVCPWIIVSLFAGVRPAEFGKKITAKGKTRPVYLLWEDVLEYEGLTISRQLAKTSMERTIDKQNVLTQWLDYLRSKRTDALNLEKKRYENRLRDITYISNLSKHDIKLKGAVKEHQKAMQSLEQLVHYRFYKHKAEWLARNHQVKEILHNRADVLRHTFASYMLTKYDRSFVAGQLGDEAKTMDAHYTDTKVQRTKKSSQSYFDLTPESLRNNDNIKLA